MRAVVGDAIAEDFGDAVGAATTPREPQVRFCITYDDMDPVEENVPEFSNRYQELISYCEKRIYM